MAEYLTFLESSTLPLPLPVVVALWCLLYALAHFLRRKHLAIAKSHAQNFIVTEEPTGQIHQQSLTLASVQIVLTAIIFGSAKLLGGPLYVFLAGGWIVTTAVSVPVTLRRILFQRALSAPDAASGSVILSYDFAVESLAFELFGAAVFVLILGVCLSHLALLGGAFFIGATACGYIRKTRRTDS